jgi:pimeloyl-ACP methyl ester carboxylesterase
MTTRPALLLVHGAWHGPWCWEQLLPELAGIDVYQVALPSSGPGPAALGDLHGDAEVVRAAVRAIDGPVVVCGHSYGGMVITQALTHEPNVARLVYLCAFQLDVGDSLAGVRQAPPAWWSVHEELGYLDPREPAERFYADAAPEVVAAALPRLTHQSLRSFRQPLTTAAWRHVPSTYIVCENDNAIPAELQRTMARRADRVVTIKAGHSPFAVAPTPVAQLLRAALTEHPRDRS